MCGETGNIRHYLWDGFGEEEKISVLLFAEFENIISDHTGILGQNLNGNKN